MVVNNLYKYFAKIPVNIHIFHFFAMVKVSGWEADFANLYSCWDGAQTSFGRSKPELA